MATSIGNLIATVGLQLGDLDRDIRNATGKLTKFASKLDTLGKDISLKVTAPIVAMGTASVMAFSQFEKGMAQVATIAQAAPAELKAMGDGARQLSMDLGVNLTDSVNGLYEALSANIPKENALSFLETAAKAAIGGGTQVKTVVDGLTSALNAWKIPASQATEVSDKFFVAIRNGKVNMEQLAGSIGSIGPTANSFGVSLDEILAGLATLTKQGVKPAEAFTQMKAAITAMAKPNKDMVTLLESIGYTSGSTAIKQLGLVGALDLLRASAGNLDTLTEALGSTEALGAATGLTGENMKTFKGDLDAVKNSSGEMGKAYEIAADTMAVRIDKLKAAFENLSVTIGEQLVPILEPLVDKLKALVDEFGDLDEATKKNIVEWGLIAAVVGPVLIVLSSLVNVVAGLWKGLSALWLLAKPVFVFLGAEGALAVGIMVVMMDAFIDAVEICNKSIDASGGWLKAYVEFWDNLVAIISDAYDAIKDFGEGLGKFLMSPIETAKGWIDGLMRSFLELIGVVDTFEERQRQNQARAGLLGRDDTLPGLRRAIAYDLGHIGARATGGPVSAGSPYLVGEHGPELFTPGVTGRISNHRDTAATLGVQAAGPTIHIHLTAGVSSEVRAEVTAMLPRITKAISNGLLGAKETATPMGRALRA